MRFYLKQSSLFLLFIFFALIFITFTIYFPHEAFAMAPPHNIIEDYYGNKEYIGNDAYGHFHNPNTHNVVKPTPIYELDGRPIHALDGKISSRTINPPYDRHELHFWTHGHTITNGNPVTYYFEPKGTVFELDSASYEGTISTDVDSVTWARRNQNNIEIIRDYCIYVDNISKKGLLSRISLCVETLNENVVFLYLKCNEIGKRKILWSIWEKNRGKYDSYKQFKRSWDSKSGIWSNIKKDVRDDIRAEVEDLLGIRKIKRDLKKSVRVEVEKLLRETHPFSSSRSSSR